MQEWIIAMLVIGILLILRDMAKTILEGWDAKEKEYFLPDGNPQRERVQRYARSFKKLSDTFYGMPYQKDRLSQDQADRVLKETSSRVCSHCYQRQLCWQERTEGTYLAASSLIRAMEEGEEEELRAKRTSWLGSCARGSQFCEAADQELQKEKQNLIWDNRMIEGRLAVARQMQEMSEIMEMVAEDLYALSPADFPFLEELRRKLKKRHVLVKRAWVLGGEGEGRKQIFLTLRARSGQCVSVQEVAQILSQVEGAPMTSARENRCIVNGDFHTVQFLEDVRYQMLYGVARITKEEEKVSGDSFTCRMEENGQFVMCLSDGMGSGLAASQESEIVVELLEQFMDSGFSQETAARMVNSALVLKRQDGTFSTMDVCAVDLYTGICQFLKAGAATTFVKRDHWVEAISSTNLALGLVEQMEFDTASRKLYHGDYLVMVTDGVLDALPMDRSEETMKEIILDVKEEPPKEMSRGILERVLGYSNYRARDDMTVLVAGMWKK